MSQKNYQPKGNFGKIISIFQSIYFLQKNALFYRFTTLSKIIPLVTGLMDTYDEMVQDAGLDSTYIRTSELGNYNIF